MRVLPVSSYGARGLPTERAVRIAHNKDMRPFLGTDQTAESGEQSPIPRGGLQHATSALKSASACKFATAKSTCGWCTSHRKTTHRRRRGRLRIPVQQLDPSVFSPPFVQIYLSRRDRSNSLVLEVAPDFAVNPTRLGYEGAKMMLSSRRHRSFERSRSGQARINKDCGRTQVLAESPNDT